MKMKRGFTLIELLVVIAIIGIIASIILATLSGAKRESAIAAGEEQSQNIFNSLGANESLQADFNECAGTTVGDLSGSGNVGTMIYAASWSTNTYNNYGCSFLATSHYVIFANPVSLTSANVTLSAWIYPTSVGGGVYRIIMSIRNACGNANVQMHLDNATGALTFDDTSVNISSYVPPLNQWTFVVQVLNGSALTMYADGSLVYTGTAGARDLTQTLLQIGTDGSCGNFFAGNLDDVHIYNQSLTSDEVKQLYIAGAQMRGIEVADADK